MAAPERSDNIGYYTVTESDRTGWTGGLLILNAAGRPLEFQCTLPVRPTRTHEILFGPTLREHLVGEVIARALLEKTRTPISLLCCDQPEALGASKSMEVPVALAVEAAEPEEGPITGDMLLGAGTVSIAGGHLFVPMEQVETVEQIAPRLADLPDLTEPFERIREAIREAQSQLARAA